MTPGTVSGTCVMDEPPKAVAAAAGPVDVVMFHNVARPGLRAGYGA